MPQRLFKTRFFLKMGLHYPTAAHLDNRAENKPEPTSKSTTDITQKKLNESLWVA